MTKIINLMCCMAFASIASCQETRTVKITVTEENGNPIESVDTTVTFLGYSGETTQRKIGLTDPNGVFQVSGEPQLRMYVTLKKEGYYSSDSGRLSRTQNHKLIYVLKKIKKPIPLFAKRLQVVPPVKDADLGYDLELGDWVNPHGNGKVTDVIFNVHHEKKDFWTLDYRLKVTFPNKHDGIQQFKKTQFSELKSPYHAPENGFIPDWTQYATRNGKESEMARNVDPLRGHWMRVRTKVDNEGRIISANHVKVYGDFPDIRYYFNPTSNDRNLEFDPKRNLFTDLESTEQVHEP